MIRFASFVMWDHSAIPKKISAEPRGVLPYRSLARRRDWPAEGKICHQICQIRDVHRAATVNIPLLGTGGNRAAEKEVGDKVSQIGNVESATIVNVTPKKAATGITNTVSVSIFLKRRFQSRLEAEQ